MTHLTDAPEQPAIASRKRRPTESPRFWLLLAFGSIAFHALFLLGLRWLDLRASLAVSSADSVPVELIEIAPDTAPPMDAIESAPAESQAPPAEDIAPPVAEAAPPASSEPAAPEIAALPPSEFAEAPPTPESPVAAPVPPVSTDPPNVPLSPAPPANPAPTTPPEAPPEAIDPATEPLPNTNLPEPTEPRLPPSDELPGGLEPAEPSEPGSPDTTTGGDGTESDLPDINIGAEVSPARFVASVSASPIPPEEATDIPEQIAQPIEPRRDFVNDAATSSCEVAPEVMGYLGAPADFSIIIDTDPNDPSVGYVVPDAINLRQTSGSPAYDDLAACLLRDWVFRPAMTQGTSPPSSEVIVSVRIEPG